MESFQKMKAYLQKYNKLFSVSNFACIDHRVFIKVETKTDVPTEETSTGCTVQPENQFLDKNIKRDNKTKAVLHKTTLHTVHILTISFVLILRRLTFL